MLRNSKTFDGNSRGAYYCLYRCGIFPKSSRAAMRLAFLLFIFLVGFNACSSFYLNAKQFEDRDHINTEPLSGPRFFTGNKNSALSKRGLRSYDGPKKNKNNIDDKIKEERAGIPGLSMLDDLGYKLALDRKMNPADIFPRLGFGKSRKGVLVLGRQVI
ncbi:hypothetical protein JG687_00009538 [Phytophthora cactorum]|uniref:Uncharacterized protein n=1 Tax=Phytophthora cactorum TaxID=29920 RepID=A0A8T1UBE7_9STRA|nr:hypothetical protein JG687_00009538 [Phytophthora cactorum]